MAVESSLKILALSSYFQSSTFPHISPVKGLFPLIVKNTTLTAYLSFAPNIDG